MDKEAFSISEFIERYSISRPFLYVLWKTGKGPKRTKIAGKVLIARADAQEWLARFAEVTPVAD